MHFVRGSRSSVSGAPSTRSIGKVLDASDDVIAATASGLFATDLGQIMPSSLFSNMRMQIAISRIKRKMRWGIRPIGTTSTSCQSWKTHCAELGKVMKLFLMLVAKGQTKPPRFPSRHIPVPFSLVLMKIILTAKPDKGLAINYRVLRMRLRLRPQGFSKQRR
ncbi:hypothetical protein I7I51_02606 [Histoplasma capsulatum]|uniref:Uncharacterized protein n=1 Tax=Ajellomyces capsulatus TaxID=5037 RepID=A0A8A1MDS4_AJECA|nr:hypothetical protein I7I51_02606 [Histoplasma capsulatum]